MSPVAYIGRVSTEILNDTDPDQTRMLSQAALEKKILSLVKEGFEDNEFEVLEGEPGRLLAQP